MVCNCVKPKNYVATRPDGSTAVYSTETQAAADVRRNGGSYSIKAA